MFTWIKCNFNSSESLCTENTLSIYNIMQDTRVRYLLIVFFFLLSGDFSLHIYPVELEDDGTYQCQASPTNDGQPALRSRFAKLSVLVPPQKPKILQGDFLVTTEDRELVIECISSAGKPPAEASTLPLFISLSTHVYRTRTYVCVCVCV